MPTIESQEKTGAQALGTSVGSITARSSLQRRVHKGLTYAKVRDIREDPTVKLCRRFVVAPALEAGWSIEAEGDVPQDIVDFVDRLVTPHHDHIMRSALLGMIDYGWIGYEVVWETREDLKWYVKKFKDLFHDITDILVNDATGAYAGLKNRDVILEPEETLLISQEVEGTQWYGNSDMTSVWRAMQPYESVQDTQEAYDSRVSGTHWVVHYPPGTSPFNGRDEVDNAEIADSILRKLEANGKVAVPTATGGLPDEPGWRIELMTDSGAGGSYLLERQRYIDVLKVRAFGAPERAILEGEFGTKAEAETHGDLAAVNINLRRREVVRHLNWHVVNRALIYNFGEQYENKVWIEPNPLSDSAMGFLQQVYMAIVASPAGTEELDLIDAESLRDRLQIPSREIILPEPNVKPGVLGRVGGGFRNALRRMVQP